MAIQVTAINGMGSATVTGSTVTTTGLEADDVMHFSEDFILEAGVADYDNSGLDVEQNGTPNKSVNVLKGVCYVLNSSYSRADNTNQRFWRVEVDSTQNVTITDNASGNPRIDIICIKVDTGATPDSEATNVATAVAVAGTPAASPAVPATPSNYLKIAEVAVANGFTSITNANITDTRTRVVFADNTVPTDAIQDNAVTSAKINWDFWKSAEETWTYASATTITVPSDATTKYKKGDKVRLKQGGGYKYFYVVGVTATVLTVTGGSDYTVANSAITDNDYSHGENLMGFPDQFTYSSTVTAGSGTFTSVAAVAKFWIENNNCTVQVKITITTNGTAASDVRFTLPVNVGDTTYQYEGSGRDSSLHGQQCTFEAPTNGSTLGQAIVRKYDATYPGGTGSTLHGQVTYKY